MVTTVLCCVVLAGQAPSEADPVAALARAPGFSQAMTIVRESDAEVIRRGLENSRTRGLIAWALSRHPRRDLRETLESKVGAADQVLGYYAALALGAIGDARSVPILADRLAAKPRDYWELARRTRDGYRPLFHRIRRPRTEVVYAEAHQPNLRVACASMEALGRMGGEDAEATLSRALQSEQHLVRYGAVRGLAVKCWW